VIDRRGSALVFSPLVGSCAGVNLPAPARRVILTFAQPFVFENRASQFFSA
jgi:hypothetical protein